MARRQRINEEQSPSPEPTEIVQVDKQTSENLKSSLVNLKSLLSQHFNKILDANLSEKEKRIKRDFMRVRERLETIAEAREDAVPVISGDSRNAQASPSPKHLLERCYQLRTRNALDSET